MWIKETFRLISWSAFSTGVSSIVGTRRKGQATFANGNCFYIRLLRQLIKHSSKCNRPLDQPVSQSLADREEGEINFSFVCCWMLSRVQQSTLFLSLTVDRSWPSRPWDVFLLFPSFAPLLRSMNSEPEASAMGRSKGEKRRNLRKTTSSWARERSFFVHVWSTLTLSLLPFLVTQWSIKFVHAQSSSSIC